MNNPYLQAAGIAEDKPKAMPKRGTLKGKIGDGTLAPQRINPSQIVPEGQPVNQPSGNPYLDEALGQGNASTQNYSSQNVGQFFQGLTGNQQANASNNPYLNEAVKQVPKEAQAGTPEHAKLKAKIKDLSSKIRDLQAEIKDKPAMINARFGAVPNPDDPRLSKLTAMRKALSVMYQKAGSSGVIGLNQTPQANPQSSLNGFKVKPQGYADKAAQSVQEGLNSELSGIKENEYRKAHSPISSQIMSNLDYEDNLSQQNYQRMNSTLTGRLAQIWGNSAHESFGKNLYNASQSLGELGATGLEQLGPEKIQPILRAVGRIGAGFIDPVGIAAFPSQLIADPEGSWKGVIAPYSPSAYKDATLEQKSELAIQSILQPLMVLGLAHGALSKFPSAPKITNVLIEHGVPADIAESAASIAEKRYRMPDNAHPDAAEEWSKFSKPLPEKPASSPETGQDTQNNGSIPQPGTIEYTIAADKAKKAVAGAIKAEMNHMGYESPDHVHQNTLSQLYAEAANEYGVSLEDASKGLEYARFLHANDALDTVEPNTIILNKAKKSLGARGASDELPKLDRELLYWQAQIEKLKQNLNTQGISDEVKAQIQSAIDDTQVKVDQLTKRRTTLQALIDETQKTQAPTEQNNGSQPPANNVSTNESTPPVAENATTDKEPWQMTRDEWRTDYANKLIKNNGLDANDRDTKGLINDTLNMNERLGWLDKVRQAFESGEDVPPNVLNEWRKEVGEQAFNNSWRKTNRGDMPSSEVLARDAEYVRRSEELKKQSEDSPPTQWTPQRGMISVDNLPLFEKRLSEVDEADVPESKKVSALRQVAIDAQNKAAEAGGESLLWDKSRKAWDVYRAKRDAEIGQAHYNSVEQAAKDGKISEGIKDYPDLSEKYDISKNPDISNSGKQAETGNTQASIEMLGSAMRDAGIDDKQIAAIKAAVSNILKMGEEQGKPLNLIQAVDQIDPTGKLKQDITRQVTETPEFKQWFGDSRLVDESGKPKVMYSGHGNVDIFGDQFKTKNATAGAFYATDDPAIASNYANSKLGVKETYDNASNYKIQAQPGKPFNKSVWDIRLSPAQKAVFDNWFKDTYDENGLDAYLKENAPYDADMRTAMYRGGSNNLGSWWKFMDNMGENVAYPKHGDEPLFERQVKSTFAELMDKAGIKYKDAEWSQPGVLPVYLRVENPIYTDKPFPQDLLKALERAVGNRKTVDFPADKAWTRDYPIANWVQDIKDGNEFWATHIPKEALNIIKSYGYDGIVDRGGKMGGASHDVTVFFDPTQAKSAIRNRGTFDTTKPSLLKQSSNEGIKGAYDPVSKTIQLATGKADISTAIHEVGHYFHDVLLDHPEYGDVIRKTYGDMSNTKGAESFAKHLENYFRTGKAPNAQLRTVFSAIREWMRGIYDKFSGGKASPEVKAVFDKELGKVTPDIQKLIDEFDSIASDKPQSRQESRQNALQTVGKAETEPTQSKIPDTTKRFDYGKNISPSQRNEILKTLGDAYEDNGHEKTFKGLNGKDEEVYGYEYNPDFMHTSDITGKKIRHYIKLPDGRIAHPSELFPGITESKAAGMWEVKSNQLKRSDIRQALSKGIITKNEANYAEIAIGSKKLPAKVAKSLDDIINKARNGLKEAKAEAEPKPAEIPDANTNPAETPKNSQNRGATESTPVSTPKETKPAESGSTPGHSTKSSLRERVESKPHVQEALKRLLATPEDGEVASNSGFSTQWVKDMTTVGAEYVKEGARDFADWAKEIKGVIGDKLNEKDLHEMYERSLAHAASIVANRFTNYEREFLGLDELPAAERLSIAEALERAKKEGLTDETGRIASEILDSKKPRGLSSLETVAIQDRLSKIDQEWEKNSSRIDEMANKGEDVSTLVKRQGELLNETDRLQLALKKGGSEPARALAFRKTAMFRDGSYMDLRKRLSSIVGKVNEKQDKVLKETSKKLADLERQLEAERAKNAMRSIREDEYKRRSMGRARTKEQLRAERKDLLGQLRDLGVKAVDPEETPLASGFSGEALKNSYETAKIYGKLAHNIIRDGATSLEEVVDRMKTYIPGITDDMVYRALSEYRIKELPKEASEQSPKQPDEFAGKTKELREEARLRAQIGDKEPSKPPESKPKPTSDNIEALRKELKTIRENKNLTNAQARRARDLETKIAEYTVHDIKQKQLNQRPRSNRELQLEHELAMAKAKHRLWEEAQREKTVWDHLLSVQRGMLLSGVGVLGKLTAATLGHAVITPVEDLLGAGIGKMTGLNHLTTEGNISGRALKNMYHEFFNKATYADGWEKLKSGVNSLDAKYYEQDPAAMRNAEGFFVNLHGAWKTPLQRAAFASEATKLAEFYAKKGFDPMTPDVMGNIVAQSYATSKRAILMNDSYATDLMGRVLSAIKGGDKTTAGYAAVKAQMPITRVPINFFARGAEYSFGSVYGIAKGLEYHLTGKLKITPDMSAEEVGAVMERAGKIQRALKRGGVGLGLIAIGYYGKDMGIEAGGYYGRGIKKDDKAPTYGHLRIGGHDVPQAFAHIPFLEAIQLGATLRRWHDSMQPSPPNIKTYPNGSTIIKTDGFTTLISKSGNRTIVPNNQKPLTFSQASISAALNYAQGASEQLPFLEFPMQTSHAMDSEKALGLAAGNLGATFIPQIQKEIAKWTDTEDKRRAQGFLDVLKLGIPWYGIRQQVPTQKQLDAQKALDNLLKKHQTVHIRGY